MDTLNMGLAADCGGRRMIKPEETYVAVMAAGDEAKRLWVERCPQYCRVAYVVEVRGRMVFVAAPYKQDRIKHPGMAWTVTDYERTVTLGCVRHSWHRTAIVVGTDRPQWLTA